MSYKLMRQAHFGLAALALVALLIIATTGLILGVNAIGRQSRSQATAETRALSVSAVADSIQARYSMPLKMEVNRWGEVNLQYFSDEGEELTIAINPVTAEEIAPHGEEDSAFIRSVITLHRSLTLHQTGRTIVLAASIALLLILLTGLALLWQRGELRAFVLGGHIEGGGYVRWHIILSRLGLIPLLVLCVTAIGMYFGRDAGESYSVTQASELASLQLGELQSLSFPLLEDDEPIYTIIEREGNKTQRLLHDLHMGSTNRLWALILSLSALALWGLFFTGFAIFFVRYRARKKGTPKTPKGDSVTPIDILLLIGSEQGSTLAVGSELAQQWQAMGLNVRLSLLNDYERYNQPIRQIIVMTCTYGKGEAPSNASEFMQRFEAVGAQTSEREGEAVPYSIVGFGSRKFRMFCTYAYELEELFAQQSWLKPLLPLHTIDNKSKQDLQAWLEAWEGVNPSKQQG